MTHILKRSYPTFLVYYIFVIVLLTGIRFLLGGELNVLFTLMGGFVLFMYPFGTLMMSEQYEEKHRGYAILSALPVSSLEITAQPRTPHSSSPSCFCFPPFPPRHRTCCWCAPISS